MGFDATSFSKNRFDSSITESRIKQILNYIIECHRLLLKAGVTYSKKDISNAGTVMFEDHLKFEFVENFLVSNKRRLQDKISELAEINFACETQQRYLDTIDGKTKLDKIDIYINKLGLKNCWCSVEDEHLYLAIECKRIKIKSDSNDYVSDIEKYTIRNHINLRLPFEGQIAFIENRKLNHSIIKDEVNSILMQSNTIKTELFLQEERLHSTIDGTYLSKHRRNIGDLPFSVYHLMFDYTDVVVD